jgi:hypothetical protein
VRERGGDRPRQDGGAVADEVLEAADAALERLEASLARAHDLPDSADRRDVSAALFGVRQRLREVLPELRVKLIRTPKAEYARVAGSGG